MVVTAGVLGKRVCVEFAWKVVTIVAAVDSAEVESVA